jgi:hypothetical protein
LRWTRWSGLVAGLGILSGCAYGYRGVAQEGRYSSASRPDASYYCYDCHGYRYFDPYYDWCVRYGFRYAWNDHPRTTSVYRQRYVRIKESHPDYGRYRYPAGYRRDTRYREARDYDSWRSRPRERDDSRRERTKDVRRSRDDAKGRESNRGPKESKVKRRNGGDSGSRERNRAREGA